MVENPLIHGVMPTSIGAAFSSLSASIASRNHAQTQTHKQQFKQYLDLIILLPNEWMNTLSKVLHNENQ